MTAFNAEPWNDSYTHDTARKQLVWHLEVPGCVGLVSVNDRIIAFAIGYRGSWRLGCVVLTTNLTTTRPRHGRVNLRSLTIRFGVEAEKLA